MNHYENGFVYALENVIMYKTKNSNQFALKGYPMTIAPNSQIGATEFPLE